MKRVAKLVLFAVLMSLLIASLAHASLPGDYVIIGDKAFALDVLFSNPEEVNQALAEMPAGGLMLFKLSGVAEDPTHIMTQQPASAAEIAGLPELTFKDAQGIISRYAPGLGDRIDDNGDEFEVIGIE